MRRVVSKCAIGLAAAFILAAAASTASANNLSVNEQEFRAMWPRLTFDVEATEIVCAVTLLGSFHSRTIRKIARALIGAITSATMGTCEEGSATVLRLTLPWHVLYEGFTGTLPNIVGVRVLLIGAAFRAENSGIACLAATDAAEPSGAEHLVSLGGLAADGDYEIDIDDPSFLCSLAGDVNLAGSAFFRTLGERNIVVTLI